MESIPDCVWRYWGIIEFMNTNPGLYTMEKLRTEAHDDVCKYYNITKEQALPITNNLNKYGMPWKDPSMFVIALRALAATGEIISFSSNTTEYTPTLPPMTEPERAVPDNREGRRRRK